MKGIVSATCISEKKGLRKHPVPYVTLKENHGIVGDAHAANWHRQISLLADESVDTMRSKGASLNAGDFAENILTKGIDLKSLTVGTRLSVGETELEVTQIGKECHAGCAIREQVGDCIMPRRGVFCRILKGGLVKPGDSFRVTYRPDTLPSA